jgi:hypothetical protein
MGKPWADYGRRRKIGDAGGSPISDLPGIYFGADDGIRTREPHLGKGDANRPLTPSHAADVLLRPKDRPGNPLNPSVQEPVVERSHNGEFDDAARQKDLAGTRVIPSRNGPDRPHRS